MSWASQRFEVGEPSLEHVIRPIEAAAFWTAIALPFLHVPLLWRGIQTNQEVAVFFGLLLLNIVAFVIGHGHKSG